MNAQTEIDLGVLHDAIAADIRATFPQLVTVQFYREAEEGGRKLPPMPACLLELEEFEDAPDVDPGTGQLAVMAKFSARLLIGFRTENAKVAIRMLAGALAAWLRKRRFKSPSQGGPTVLPTGPAEVVGAWPDDFTPELDQCEVWRVEWRQVLHLGEGLDFSGTTPTQVVFSWAPEIGIPHEADYQPLPELTPP